MRIVRGGVLEVEREEKIVRWGCVFGAAFGEGGHGEWHCRA